MEPRRFYPIVAEWRRIFPKLREMPCPADIYGLDMEKGDLNEISERDFVSLSSYDEIPLSVLEDTEEYQSSETTDRDMLTLSSDEEISSYEREDSEEDSSDASEEEGEEEEPVFPGEWELKYNYFGSDWFFLRIKLWREPQYGQGQSAHDRIASIWRTNLEIMKIGWPVMPLEAYYHPESYLIISQIEYDLILANPYQFKRGRFCALLFTDGVPHTMHNVRESDTFLFTRSACRGLTRFSSLDEERIDMPCTGCVAPNKAQGYEYLCHQWKTSVELVRAVTLIQWKYHGWTDALLCIAGRRQGKVD
jgi:hypothetical protein